MKTTLWRLYFAVVGLLTGIAVLFPQQRRIWESVDTVCIMFALVGLFGFAWEKNIFDRLLWRIFSVAFFGWTFFYLFILPPLPSVTRQITMQPWLIGTIAILPYSPLIVALFLYGYGKRKT